MKADQARTLARRICDLIARELHLDGGKDALGTIHRVGVPAIEKAIVEATQPKDKNR